MTRLLPARPALLCLLAVGLVAGCTSSSKPAHPPTTAPSGSAGSSVTPAALAAQLTSTLRSLSSAHLDIDAGVLGGTSTADVTLSGGAVTAADLHTTQSGTSVEVLTVGGQTYAKVPGTAKPWVTVTATSTNPAVKAIAATLSISQATTGIGAIPGLIAAAKSLQDEGQQSVNGSTATHYAMSIDPTTHTDSAALQQLLSSLGTKPLPVQLWVDSAGRPVKFSLAVPLGSQSLSVTVSISNFNAPLTLAAPPSDQVGTN